MYHRPCEALYTAERFDGAQGESAQRSRARLERHQRTVERAVCLYVSFIFFLFAFLDF